SSCDRAHLHLHSFPTRRSSDLTTSPRAASPENAVSPLISRTLPNRPMAVKVGPDRRKGAMWPPSTSRSSSVRVSCRSTAGQYDRSEEHTSELQSLAYLVCRLLL